jgi:peptidyl-tRNA hydrolase
MVFVVRRDLGWHKQKLAVMTAHAALALFKKVYKSRNPALMQWVRAQADGCESAAAATTHAAQFEAVQSWSQACSLCWRRNHRGCSV